MQAEPHILVVDDDREIRELLSRFLRKNGLRVDIAADGREMKRVLAAGKVDLVILDRVMPGEDGLSLCRELRRLSRVPIILLTLLGADSDRIAGLETGADDYVQKPFNPHELLARIKAVLRRANDLPFQNTRQKASVLHFGGWTLDRNRRRLESPAKVAVVLTDGEFDLLVAFAEHPQIVLSREQLLDLARGREAAAFDRGIDMQITRLRRKIEADPEQPTLIKTIRNKGYVFTAEVVGSAT
jgi:two-component system OmpR family response regulator